LIGIAGSEIVEDGDCGIITFISLDRWRLEVKERDGTVMAPSRSAAIRWIVHQFLMKQEAKASVRKQRQKLTKAATEGRSKPPPQRVPARHR
jgi:hypothetical protein